MLEVICNWLYGNAAAIFISSIVSLLISRRYYNKANREAVLLTIIFPTVQILGKRCTKKNYEKLFEIKLNYSIRYLYKNERNKLLRLLEKYRIVCKYDKYGAVTDSIMLYYNDKLKENGINPMPCAIRDDEGEIVANDYPPDYNYLVNYVYDVVSREYEMSSQECLGGIVNSFRRYTKEYYTEKKIDFFEGSSIEEVVKISEVTKNWKRKFDEYDKCKNDFLELSICKKALELLNETKLH